MGRIIIQLLAIFVLPFLLYGVYFLWVRQRARSQGNTPPKWEDGPWFWLVLSGLALMIGFFVVLNVLDTATPDRLITPPTLQD